LKDSQKIAGRKAGSTTKWVLLLSLIILIVGCAGYFSLPRGQLIFYVFAHLGALGILGLIGGAVGVLAKRKGRSFSIAFLSGCLLPVVVGIVAVAASGSQVSCGGSVSLAVALLVVVFYAIVNKKRLYEARHAG
jgi:hypothetical protein